MLISVQTEPARATVFTLRVRVCCVCVCYPNIFPVVFSVDFLSSGRCIISKHGGKQVVFMFMSTPVLYAAQK